MTGRDKIAKQIRILLNESIAEDERHIDEELENILADWILENRPEFDKTGAVSFYNEALKNWTKNMAEGNERN